MYVCVRETEMEMEDGDTVGPLAVVELLLDPEPCGFRTGVEYCIIRWDS